MTNCYKLAFYNVSTSKYAWALLFGVVILQLTTFGNWNNNLEDTTTTYKKINEYNNKPKYRGGGPSNTSMFDHPHAGARDSDGYWNYVPDVTHVRNEVLIQIANNENSTQQYYCFPLQPELFEQVCQVAPGLGVEGMKGYEILRHVQLNGSNPVPEEVLSNNQNKLTDFDKQNITMMKLVPTVAPASDSSDLSPPRILCAVYTYEKKHDNLRAIVDTWGWRCDGFFAASTKTVSDLGAIDLPHRGEEAYRNMWQKTRSILAFMYDNYIDEYDYFYMAGDDTYLILENLRNYIHLLETTDGGRNMWPLFIGLPVHIARNQGWEPVYNMGGPGYILNRIALQKLVTEVLPTCHAYDVFSGEDINVAKCLFQLGIFPIDTADVAHRQRFFDSNPEELYKPQVRKAFRYWARSHGWRVGLDLVSTQSVAFHHLKTPVSMKRHHAIIYDSCPEGTILKDTVRQQQVTSTTL